MIFQVAPDDGSATFPIVLFELRRFMDAVWDKGIVVHRYLLFLDFGVLQAQSDMQSCCVLLVCCVCA